MKTQFDKIKHFTSLNKINANRTASSDFWKKLEYANSAIKYFINCLKRKLSAYFTTLNATNQ